MTARRNSEPLRGRPLLIALLIAGLLGVALTAVASANRPASVRTGGLQVTFNAGFSPRAIPRTAATPVMATFAFKARTEDGPHLPRAFESSSAPTALGAQTGATTTILPSGKSTSPIAVPLPGTGTGKR